MEPLYQASVGQGKWAGGAHLCQCFHVSIVKMEELKLRKIEYFQGEFQFDFYF